MLEKIMFLRPCTTVKMDVYLINSHDDGHSIEFINWSRGGGTGLESKIA